MGANSTPVGYTPDELLELANALECAQTVGVNGSEVVTLSPELRTEIVERLRGHLCEVAQSVGVPAGELTPEIRAGLKGEMPGSASDGT